MCSTCYFIHIFYNKRSTTKLTYLAKKEINFFYCYKISYENS